MAEAVCSPLQEEKKNPIDGQRIEREGAGGDKGEREGGEMWESFEHEASEMRAYIYLVTS